MRTNTSESTLFNTSVFISHRDALTWLFLARFGHVGYTCVRAHEDVAGMQRPFQEELLSV